MSDLKCPFCKSDLEVTHKEHYQDLSEHVSDPNGVPSLKDGYDCLNQECLAFGTFSWIEDGEYYTKKPEGLGYKDWNTIQKIACPSENYHAIGSWNHYYQTGKDAIKAKTFKIDLYYYKFVFSPKEKGWKYPEEFRNMPNMWRWRVEIWRKSSDYGYTNVIPFWRMTAYCLKQFKRDYNNFKENGDTRSLKSAYCTAHSLEEWNVKPDSRFYSKLTSVLIRTFQPIKVKNINKSYEISTNSTRW
jgi:hypothetical protein